MYNGQYSQTTGSAAAVAGGRGGAESPDHDIEPAAYVPAAPLTPVMAAIRANLDRLLDTPRKEPHSRFSPNFYWWLKIAVIAAALGITALSVLVYAPANIWKANPEGPGLPPVPIHQSLAVLLKNLISAVGYNFVLNATCTYETLTRLPRMLMQIFSDIYTRQLQEKAWAIARFFKICVELVLAYYAASIYSGLIAGYRGHWEHIPPEWSISAAYVGLNWPGINYLFDYMLFPVLRYVGGLLRQMGSADQKQLDRRLQNELKQRIDEEFAKLCRLSPNAMREADGQIMTRLLENSHCLLASNGELLSVCLKVFLGLAAVYGVSGLSRGVFDAALNSGDFNSWLKAITAIAAYLPLALRMSFSLSNDIAAAVVEVLTRLRTAYNDGAKTFAKTFGQICLEKLPGVFFIGWAYNTAVTSVSANTQFQKNVIPVVDKAIDAATIIGCMVFNGVPMVDLVSGFIKDRMKSKVESSSEEQQGKKAIETIQQELGKGASLEAALKAAFEAVRVEATPEEIKDLALDIRCDMVQNKDVLSVLQERYGPYLTSEQAEQVLREESSMSSLLGMSASAQRRSLWGSAVQLVVPVAILCAIDQLVFSLREERNDGDTIFATMVSMWLSQLICRFLSSCFNQCRDLQSFGKLLLQFALEVLAISLLGGASVWLTLQFAKAALGLEGTPLASAVIGTVLSTGAAISLFSKKQEVREHYDGRATNDAFTENSPLLAAAMA